MQYLYRHALPDSRALPFLPKVRLARTECWSSRVGVLAHLPPPSRATAVSKAFKKLQIKAAISKHSFRAATNVLALYNRKRERKLTKPSNQWRSSPYAPRVWIAWSESVNMRKRKLLHKNISA